MLQELCRLIEFFYESGLLVAAAAGPSGCRGACPCGRWQAMSPPARDAAAGWRWLAGWGGLPHVFESFTNKSRKAGARGWFRPMAMAPHGSVAGPVAPPSGPFWLAASWFLTAETASAGCRYGPAWLAIRPMLQPGNRSVNIFHVPKEARRWGRRLYRRRPTVRP